MKTPLVSVTIKDCTVQTFRSGGKGGQHQNKTESGVRIIHEPSGAVGESREYREQPQNKKAAFRRMAESQEFQTWIQIESVRKMGKLDELDQRIDHELTHNTKVESKDENGRWIRGLSEVPGE